MTLIDHTDLADLAGRERIDSRSLIDALEDYDLSLDPEGIYTEEERETIREEYEHYANQVRELDGCVPDWSYGALMIREDCFVSYAQEFAEEVGAVDEDSHWPRIDWEASAKELAQDFTTVEYGGWDYYIR